jgi:hypothetical protein
MTQSEVRRALLRNGHLPIPVQGKRPFHTNWQNLNPTEEMITQWGEQGNNTGVLCKRTTGLDIDVEDAEAVQLILELVRKSFRGLILERTGRAPKCAVPLYVSTPFKKMVRKLSAPDGKIHKIEVLCDGQQFVVDGIHPDTGAPYTWRDLSLLDVSLMELPHVTESDMGAFLDICVEELRTKLGWLDISGVTQGTPPDNVVELRPLNERLAATEYKGRDGLNEGILAMTATLISDGVSVRDAIDQCMQFVRGVWDKIPDEHPDKAGWNWNAQRDQITDACYGFIKKECGNQPRIVDMLPDGMLKKWRDMEGRGGTPFIRKRKHWGVEDRGPADPIPDLETLDLPTVDAASRPSGNGTRKLRFRLIRFQDMRPGVEPAYLVDELMPSAGLVLVWGKQKTFKSFWLLDLFVHVSMGWAYRDHAVRQGAVVYCAFEGGHGYKGRIEAIRRHYSINDDVDVPLYVMPGQVDLIADEKALVEEFRYQLGTVVPAVVVLDTLNRSLSGSESSDKDMTLYVKAAEAVRKAFGCLCVIVHHCGYDDTHARGHTSLPAAVDAELSVMRVEGSPIVLVTVKATRDGPEGVVVRSRALPVPLDPDQNGKPRSSIVMVPDDDSTVVIPTKQGGRRDTATPLLVEILRAALDARGEYFTPDGKLALQAVDSQHVRELFYRRYVDVEEDEHKSRGAQKQAYKRGVEGAIAKKIVNGQKDDQGRQLLWFVRDEGEAL